MYELNVAPGYPARLIAGVPKGDPSIFERLVACMKEPYDVLYLLHTTRGEGEIGRYQSPPVALARVKRFIDRYRSFLSADGRFDLWAHSESDDATVVWDRHNKLFAYGPLDRFEAELRALGFQHGEVEAIGWHAHHYRQECDALATELLSGRPWAFSPLRPEDVQFPDPPSQPNAIEVSS